MCTEYKCAHVWYTDEYVPVLIKGKVISWMQLPHMCERERKDN